MPATKNEFTATEVKAGLLVLASLVILVVFMAAVRGFRLVDENVTRYTSSFTDIAGLNPRADVRFGGVEVGRVVGIAPDARDRRRILVTVEVDADIPVNRASVASIKQVSLTAEKHFEISTGDADAELLEDGDTIPSRAGNGGLFDVPDLNGVTKRLEALLDSMILLVGGAPPEGADDGTQPDMVDMAELMGALRATLVDSSAAARDVSSLISENRVGISEVLVRMTALQDSATELMALLTEMADENRAPLNATIVNLHQLSEETARRLEELADALAAALQQVNDFGGSAGDLLDGQGPVLLELVDNLRATTENLKRLSAILADRPGALVRGAAPRGRENGERR